MIDTIHLRVALPVEVYDRLLRIRSGYVLRCKNYDRGVMFDRASRKFLIESDVLVPFFSDNFLPSWSYGIYYQVKNCTLDVEFSVPKVLYGENVTEVKTYDELMLSVKKVEKKLKEMDPGIPSLDNAVITRLDICRMLEFTNHEEVLRNLEVFSNFCYLNSTDKLFFPGESVMWKLRHYSMKFYSKAEEFLRHDYHYFVDPSKVLARASNLLRFEVTMRKGMLDSLFGKEFMLKDIKFDKIGSLIGVFITKLTKVEAYMMGIIEVGEKLAQKYGNTRGVQLYMFYRAYYSDNPYDIKYLKHHYSRSQINKNLQLIKDAGVGIYEDIRAIPDDPVNNVIRKNTSLIGSL